MEKQGTILTGDRPTGPLHLGHYIGSLCNRVELQYKYHQNILIADIQALTDNAENPEKIRENIIEVLLDYLAVGLKPEKNIFCLQSLIPELAELTMYYLNLVTLARLKRNPTVKDEMRQKGFGENVPAGFLIYPVSQAADITAFKADLVPVGEDQVPMIEQTNEIVRQFNRLYGENVLVECRPLLSKSPRLPGTDGKEKMGKSTNNAIYIKDSPDTIARKIKMMFTDPGHLRVEDPGKVEGNPVFTYLDAFYPDKKKLEDIKAHYKRGGLGDSVVKNQLNEVIQELLRPIRKEREKFSRDKGQLMKMIRKDSSMAREVVKTTLVEVRRVLSLEFIV
jgi:tryptophanyl-tRNA synthetase